jgi:hypothetical protein
MSTDKWQATASKRGTGNDLQAAPHFAQLIDSATSQAV